MHNGMSLTRIQGQGQGHRDPNALAEVDRQSPYGANFYVRPDFLGKLRDICFQY